MNPYTKMKKNILITTAIILTAIASLFVIHKSWLAVNSFVKASEGVKEAKLIAAKAEYAKETAATEAFKSMPVEVREHYEKLSTVEFEAKGELNYLEEREMRICWHLLRCLGACLVCMVVCLWLMSVTKKKPQL